MLSLEISKGSCNTVEDPFGKICVPNKTEDLNLKEFNIIKWMNEWIKKINTTFHIDVHVNLDGGKFNSEQNQDNDQCRYECEKPVEHHVWQKLMFGILP